VENSPAVIERTPAKVRASPARLRREGFILPTSHPNSSAHAGVVLTRVVALTTDVFLTAATKKMKCRARKKPSPARDRPGLLNPSTNAVRRRATPTHVRKSPAAKTLIKEMERASMFGRKRMNMEAVPKKKPAPAP
jgi:hypothetical protein